VNTTVLGIFSGVLVKLDVFHWLKNWNDIVMDPKTAHAGIFRALMSRACFNVEAGEFDRAKANLERIKKRVVSIREIMKEANSVIPEPGVLRSNVEAVLRYIQGKDAETEHVLVNVYWWGESPLIGKDGCIYQSQVAWTTDLNYLSIDNVSIDDSHHIVDCFHAACAKRVVSPTSGTDSCLVFLEGDVSVLVRSHDRSFVARIHGSE
jgi:hypothetical protein